MSIMDKIRARLEDGFTAELRRVEHELRAKAPIPYSTAPPLEELQKILADLQKRQPRRSPHLKGAP
ncbi:hypothetical protein [Streptomyces sp. NPDC059786]|uniref:hypothetical protein n=1 Tax=Streptomyces sp. NPDC059786 TaxID=3346946 RepID=UPI003654EBA4